MLSTHARKNLIFSDLFSSYFHKRSNLLMADQANAFLVLKSYKELGTYVPRYLKSLTCFKLFSLNDLISNGSPILLIRISVFDALRWSPTCIVDGSRQCNKFAASWMNLLRSAMPSA